MLRGGAVSCWF